MQSIFNRNIVFVVPKEFGDPQVSDDLKVNSIKSMNLNVLEEFDDPQLFDDPKENSIGSMDFDNPKVYGDTSIFDGLVESIMVDVDRQQLCDILEHGEGWRRVMGVVPRSRQDRTNKYSADQV